MLSNPANTGEQMLGTSGTSNPQQWLIDTIGGGTSDAGMRVNGWTVLTSGPVYQAVNLVSSDLAVLPIEVLQQRGQDGKRKKDKNHPVYKIWNEDGNDEMLPFSVRQTLQSWAMIYGNGCGGIHFEGGRAVGVYPIRPWAIQPERLPFVPELGAAAGELVYRVWDDYGREETLFQNEVFHIKLLGNGIWGHSPLGLFSNTFGNGMAQEKFVGKSFANSSRPSGVLETDKGRKSMNAEARANLRREWDEVNSGLDNTGKIGILWDGIKWKAMSVSNRDAQMLESRKYYREEVAGIYNIPPHKLGAMENSAVRANIEEQNRSYVGTTLMPHAINWQQESREKLMTERERRRRSHVVRVNFKALLRADHKTRYEAYAIGRQWGWLTANDVRRYEDMDEAGNQGDVFMVPSNMADASTGIPFTGKDKESQPQTPGSAVAGTTAEQNRGQARNTLMELQSSEIKNLRTFMQSKKTPFTENARKHYLTLSAVWQRKLSEEIDTAKHGGILETYAQQSFELVKNCESMDDLMDIAIGFPRRAEQLLTTFFEDDPK